MAELDGAVFDRPVAAFRIIPYFAREKLDLPPLQDLIDISQQRLLEMEDEDIPDPEAEEEEEVSGETAEND